MIQALWTFAVETLTNWRVSWRIFLLVLLGEMALLFVIIDRVPYTEIDWKAYMDEVEGFLNGTWDYTMLKGDTGPLVYPAGFVYVFSGLYYVTDHGTDILSAQYIFAALYLAFIAIVMYLYIKSRHPPYLLGIISMAAFRVHSIFVLRLFNDPVAMLFLYAACVLFIKHRWTEGCALFSLAVSIKMNVLLFAPGLLLLLLLHCGYKGAFWRIFLCGLIQLALGAPFMLENPVGYIQRSFDLGRQFFYVWTVNWRLIPEDLFLDRTFHIALLALHTCLLAALAYKFSRSFHVADFGKYRLSARAILFILFASNLMGVAAARSLHYQFYVWYYHSLAWLLWTSRMPVLLNFIVLGAIEYAWNVYPSTVISSAVLHAAHLVLLAAVFTTPIPPLHKLKKQ